MRCGAAVVGAAAWWVAGAGAFAVAFCGGGGEYKPIAVRAAAELPDTPPPPKDGIGADVPSASASI